MSSFKRLITLLLSLVITILFAGVAELFCTPYEGWFSSLKMPTLFVGEGFHNVCWLACYLTIAWATSGSIVKKDHVSLIIWGVFLGLSVLTVAAIFAWKSLLFASVTLALSTVSSVVLSIRNHNNSWAICLIVCWYLYLTGVCITLAVLNG